MEVYEGSFTEILNLHRQVPEMRYVNSTDYYIERINNRPSLALIGKIDGVAVGFKLGYQKSADTFYSWLGGVLTEYRGKGVANALLRQQEQWALAKGYKQIRVKSMNCYPNMIKMLISNRYKICSYEFNGHVDKAKIHFEKVL